MSQMKIYIKNRKFKTRRIAHNTYFTHKNGQPIRTDNLGSLIWESCKRSNFSQLRKSVSEKLNCPRDLLKYYLDLLNIAGVIKIKSKKNMKSIKKREENIFFNDLVSIIVVNFNGEKIIVDCLKSIRKQTHKNKEVVLWDNNSSDNSLKIIRKKFPEVKVIANKKNILFAKAVNLSIKECAGKYLIILNPDTELNEEFIRELLIKAKSKKKAAAVAPKMLFYFMPTCINGIGNYTPPLGWGSDNFIGHFDFGQFDNLKEIPSACFGAVMLKRKALEDIGPLDNHYRAYYEDADWSYRARLKGWKIVPAPHAIVYHKFEGSFKDFPELKLKLAIRNRLRFAMKIFSFYYVRGFLKNYLREDFRNFMHFLKSSNFKVVKIYIFSYFSFLFQLPELFLSRNKIQKFRNKNISDKDILNLAPYYPPLLDEISAPILTVESIRNIYCWELNKKGSMAGSGPITRKICAIKGREMSPPNGKA